MISLSNGRIFCLAVAAGLTLVLANAGYARWQRPAAATVHPLTEAISISEQLIPGQLAELRERGFATIIDLRPDGEAAGQPDAAHMHEAARSNRMAFAYVPVPHGEIPASAVAALGKALAESPQPVLLYCRSGKRAARTWGLAEAARAGGADAEAILAAVKASGQSADDLRPLIDARVAQRQPAPKDAP
jgi:uncharacterized protein (TIGR01244 family)